MPARTGKLYRIVSPFIAFEDGREVPYLVNTEIYAEDHPAVKRYRDSFVEVQVLGGPVVEDATAAPGEKRTISR